MCRALHHITLAVHESPPLGSMSQWPLKAHTQTVCAAQLARRREERMTRPAVSGANAGSTSVATGRASAAAAAERCRVMRPGAAAQASIIFSFAAATCHQVRTLASQCEYRAEDQLVPLFGFHRSMSRLHAHLAQRSPPWRAWWASHAPQPLHRCPQQA